MLLNVDIVVGGVEWGVNLFACFWISFFNKFVCYSLQINNNDDDDDNNNDNNIQL